MADPKTKILPVFRPRVDAGVGAKRIAPVFATTRGQSKQMPKYDINGTQLADNVLTSEEDENAAPDIPVRKPQKRRVLVFDEADLDPTETASNFNPPVVREEIEGKRTTVLRVKRKRDESTLDAIVLEAPATKKRELEDLESALKVMNIRKDSQGVQHEEISSVPKSSNYVGLLNLTASPDSMSMDLTGAGPLMKSETVRDRDFKRRVFRYIGTVNSSGKFTNEDVQKRVAEMKVDRSPMKAANLGEESKEARFAASRAEQTTARFRQMNRLRRASHEDSDDRSLNVLELTSQTNERNQQHIPKGKGVSRQPDSSGRAPGAQLPVIKRAKDVEDSDDYVVDYFVYDAQADNDHLDSGSTAVVHVENFDESLLDDYVPGSEYSDKEFDSDDSQNRDWDYGSESEEDTSSSEDDSDRDERRRAFFDPFAAVKKRKSFDDEEEGGDHYEDGQYHPVVFKTRTSAGSSSEEDDDGFDHFGEAYVQYREYEDLQNDDEMDE
eukprot:TRINITY_DN1420_c0_g1_i3.p2 TRINITY_DN1420_c0_g1~~TRINITY_DN1420_c0_g1_i3.p2  ORF type:complete len:504 (+),score=111.27 TRINITY_DN1420_c0_g1_i3:27-1514(+)